MSPRLKRLLHGRAFSDYYEINALLADREALGEGTFGATAPYYCEVCGPNWVGYSSRKTFDASSVSPAEYAHSCELCGCGECGTHDDPDLSFTATRRFTIREHKHMENAA